MTTNQTQKITLTVPSDILLSLNESEKELEKNIKLSLAIRLFQKNKLTLGKAAQLADLSRYDFESVLVDSGVSISSLSAQDVLQDVEKLRVNLSTWGHSKILTDFLVFTTQ